jgi:hypothetical protein
LISLRALYKRRVFRPHKSARFRTDCKTEIPSSTLNSVEWCEPAALRNLLRNTSFFHHVTRNPRPSRRNLRAGGYKRGVLSEKSSIYWRFRVPLGHSVHVWSRRFIGPSPLSCRNLDVNAISGAPRRCMRPVPDHRDSHKRNFNSVASAALLDCGGKSDRGLVAFVSQRRLT